MSEPREAGSTPVRLKSLEVAATPALPPIPLGDGRVAVIGGGFYGCHIAITLAALGLDVTLFEAAPRLLTAASGANQFRLHLGFHYARSYTTRMQSRDGFRRFVQHYPDLTAEVPENIYAVSTEESLLDYETYRMIMAGSAIPFEEIDRASVPITGVSGMMRTEERVLLVDRARARFEAVLGPRAVTGHPVRSLVDRGGFVDVDGERFDVAIDATWGHFTPPATPVIFEPTLMLYYQTRDPFPAVTMVDGPLYSVYPTQDAGVFTLSSVTETPLGRFESAAAARACRDDVSASTIEVRRLNMERQIRCYLPDFAERFTYLAPQLSLKTKLVGLSDHRTCSVSAEGRVLSVLSGKVDMVFHGMERVLEMLGLHPARALGQVASQLAASV